MVRRVQAFHASTSPETWKSVFRNSLLGHLRQSLQMCQPRTPCAIPHKFDAQHNFDANYPQISSQAVFSVVGDLQSADLNNTLS